MTEHPPHLDIPSLGPKPISLGSKPRWILGSDPQRADLVLPALEVAPVHCVIEVQEQQVRVTDLGSSAGTQLDGAPITVCALKHGQRLDVGPVSIWLSDGSSTSANSLPSIPGFEVDREVGRGAGGVVYLATQSSLQRQVAMKVLAPELSHDAKVVQRFESEARAAAALAHPNVVTVFDVGSAGSVHYLSMEYMAEGSLADRLAKRGPLSWRQTLRMMSDAAKALAFAESRALVHRDIKPANLMLTETGVTKLADLGLVMDLSEEHDGGPAMGTPHFLAPEVIKGGKPGSQGDLYSLGATAYQVATGATPYQGSSTKEILRSALTTEPQSPSEHDEEIPQQVSQLILDLMAKDPAMRPQTAKEVQERIDRLNLSLGLPSQMTPGKGRRTALLLAGPLVLAAAYLAWDISRPDDASPNHAPGNVQGPSTGGTPEVSTQMGDPAFSFAVVQDGEPGNAVAGDLGSEFELRAQERFKGLQELELSDEERIKKLRFFAQEFRGSNSADTALALAGSLEERGRSVQRETEQAAQALADEVTRLLELAHWVPGEVPQHEVLQAVLAYQSSLTGDGLLEFQIQRSRTLRSLLAEGNTYLQDTLNAARVLAAQGQFSEAKTQLTEQTEAFAPSLALDLSVLTQKGQAPSELLNLQSRVQELSVLLEDIPRLAAEWGVLTRSQDRTSLGAMLGHTSGLRSELAQFNLADARRRLKDSLTKMRSEPGRGWVAGLDRDLANCQAYLQAWRSSHGSGQWRHTNALDPRSSRPRNLPVTNVHSQWVSLDGERIPLASFLARERDLRSLFENRIQRPLTPQEQEGLASLYRIQAILTVLDQVQEMFVQSSNARFSEGEVQDVLDILSRATVGQTDAGQIALAIEARTAEAVVMGLQAYSSRDYGAAAGYFERSFDIGRGSLLLLLLSDGGSLPLRDQNESATGSGKSE
ncbi:MAG: protein kinase [bacterium]|nr:protein kinase [bacterium]